MTYLIDSDVLIELERHRAPELLAKFVSHQAHLAISSVTAAEMFYGAAKSNRAAQAREALDALLANLEILPFDAGDAEHAGDIRAQLHESGQQIGAHDILIAATARARGLVMVTNNERDFTRVAGLRIENWLRS